MLRALPQDKWAIVTSCTRDLAEVRIKAAGVPRPAVIITSTDVTNGKPHPEPYLKGAEKLGLRGDECVVIEDAPAGIRAGKAAGAKVIAVKTTMTEKELRQADPDWVVEDYSQVEVVREGAEVVFRRR